MKLLALAPLLLTLAHGAAVTDPSIVSYDGWKVFRVKTGHASDELVRKLSAIPYDEWSDEPTHMDIAIAPNHLKAFEDLDLDSDCMHENLGVSIRAESAPGPTKWKRNTKDLSWFQSYHPYDDHRLYLEDLHAKFPNKSEIFSSGTSYEGRDISGIHLWGEGGKDSKPAILWHGTVHAREWITTMVRGPRHRCEHWLTHIIRWSNTSHYSLLKGTKKMK
jgi:Zinc carboxypeptidase